MLMYEAVRKEKVHEAMYVNILQSLYLKMDTPSEYPKNK